MRDERAHFRKIDLSFGKIDRCFSIIDMLNGNMPRILQLSQAPFRKIYRRFSRIDLAKAEACGPKHSLVKEGG